ncbi:serine protease [Candidatus Coxiella mudrowiae]|uniref:serine protease n=1 Tax=Candidatus Coxiella mudrowiae TaxID=2054173 RepID=UPI001FD5E0EB|nr:serine protease [Candidatus Coxiella mudrowiae]
MYAIGNTQGTEKSLSREIISNKHKVKVGEWLETDATIYFGCSRSGLFDDEGNLIGITAKMGVNFGFVIPTESISQAITQLAERSNFSANDTSVKESVSSHTANIIPEAI